MTHPTGDPRMGAKIRAKRKALEMSQAELGLRVGIGQNAISNIEKGLHHCRPRTLERIAESLGERPDYFRGKTAPAGEFESFESVLLVTLSTRALRLLRRAQAAEKASIARDLSALIESRLGQQT